MPFKLDPCLGLSSSVDPTRRALANIGVVQARQSVPTRRQTVPIFALPEEQTEGCAAAAFERRLCEPVSTRPAEAPPAYPRDGAGHAKNKDMGSV